MGGPGLFRNALLAGGALAIALLGANLAGAQESGMTASGQLDLSDPLAGIASESPAINLSVRGDAEARFTNVNPVHFGEVEGPRRLELEVAAGGGNAPLDVAIAQRATLAGDANGDIARSGSGSELRVGRGLVRRRNDAEGDRTSVYMFVASDDEALTWRPGARSEFGGRGDAFALQDQVEVGDMSAGVTYERHGVQASLAYVEREESTRVGNQSFSQDQSFTGITVTMRR
jgi:hypothetical protein